jgi:hypothetical protein
MGACMGMTLWPPCLASMCFALPSRPRCCRACKTRAHTIHIHSNPLTCSWSSAPCFVEAAGLGVRAVNRTSTVVARNLTRSLDTRMLRKTVRNLIPRFSSYVTSRAHPPGLGGGHRAIATGRAETTDSMSAVKEHSSFANFAEIKITEADYGAHTPCACL